MNIPNIDLQEFDYHLPETKIAFFPTDNRGESRLLITECNTANIKDAKFPDIVNHLDENSILILNKTKVINARINFNKSTGGKIEFLLTDPLFPSSSATITLAATQKVVWNCIVGGRVNAGNTFIVNNELNLQAHVNNKENNICEVEFSWDNPDLNFSEILYQIGKIPLPPYIKREKDLQDDTRYQTVYAKEPGSVAAPTAGLHFTDDILQRLTVKGIDIGEVNLHVGLGTFYPIKNDNITEHDMHSEKISVSLDLIKKLAGEISQKKVTAVGTTSARTLETLFVLGNKIYNKMSFDSLLVNQWDAYNINKLISHNEALNEVISYCEKHNLDAIEGETKLLIMPGYNFGIVNNLITNFHAPKSTLILLVAAFTGKELWKKMYNHALVHEYRFLSYGDSSLLIR